MLGLCVMVMNYVLDVRVRARVIVKVRFKGYRVEARFRVRFG